jgi:hypothetical protein
MQVRIFRESAFRTSSASIGTPSDDDSADDLNNTTRAHASQPHEAGIKEAFN